MVEYSVQDHYAIENVSHEISVLGVKLSSLPYVAWGFLVGMTAFGPIAAFALLAVAIVISRHLHHAEARGEPLHFDPRLQQWVESMPPQFQKIASLPFSRIEVGRKEYRE